MIIYLSARESGKQIAPQTDEISQETVRFPKILLEKEKLQYLVSPVGNWTSCSAVYKYHRSKQHEQNNFDNCRNFVN